MVTKENFKDLLNIRSSRIKRFIVLDFRLISSHGISWTWRVAREFRLTVYNYTVNILLEV